MKVAILTMFNGLDTTYSLVNVVAEHLKMLLENNIQTKVLVSEHCPDSQRHGVYLDKRIEWVKIINTINGKRLKWYNYRQTEGQVHETFFQEADIIAEDLVAKLIDVDVCIMHDIHYQGSHLIHNVAIRKAQNKLPNVKFIAITHSAPKNPSLNSKWPFSARYTPMPDTIYVYPTASGISALAKQYNVTESKCSVINNSLDLIQFMSEDVKYIARKIDLITPDILVVYPGRLTQSKKFEKVTAFAGAIKKITGGNIKVVFCDSPAMDIEPKVYKEVIKKSGYNFGIEEQDIAFTSDLGYLYGFPRKAVLELFTLSNLFICPSFSESFGLTVLEAASRGNFIVLNEAVPALKEIGIQLNAYFMRWDAKNFGFCSKERYIPSEKAYLEKHAEKVMNLMIENSVIFCKTMTRQRYSPQWIWKNQLKPLLDELAK